MARVSPGGDSKTLGKKTGSDKVCYVPYESVGHLPQSEGQSIRAPKVAWRGQAPIVDRFWAKVNRSGPVHPDLGTACWIWTGCVVSHYGQIALGHPHSRYCKRWKTHRFSWELHHGPIPEHLRVCHRCDNPVCVRPDHLFLGTQAENVHDSARKGRKNAWGIQKLNADDVLVIRSQAARGILQKDIAKAFGIARNTVSQIVNRKCWAHLPDVPGAIDQVSRAAV